MAIAALCAFTGCQTPTALTTNSQLGYAEPGGLSGPREAAHRLSSTAIADAAEVADRRQPSELIRLASHTSDDSSRDLGTNDEVPSSTTNFAPAVSVNLISLEQLESLAFDNSPAIRELDAIARQAAGFRTQVGLKANPVVGYQGQQLADAGTEQHLAFIEQEFVTGDKLSANRRVLNETVRAQLFELAAQRLRVATDVRVAFFAAYAAQQRGDLISDFQTVTDQGVELAVLRLEAGEGTRIDVLQAQVQRSEIELAEQQAGLTLKAAWAELAAVVGLPELSISPLAGQWPEAAAIDWPSAQASILQASPEYHAAQARICEARAALARHELQPIPNVQLQFGAGYDQGTESGMMNLQVGAPLPFHNQNQGNIAAARANVHRAVQAEQRVKNSILARLASASNDYDTARAAVEMYQSQILPNAQQSLELAEVAYQAGETDFIQVLIARRTFFDSNLQLLQAQATLAQARARIDGYLLQDSLTTVVQESGDDGLRGLSFGQQ